MVRARRDSNGIKATANIMVTGIITETGAITITGTGIIRASTSDFISIRDLQSRSITVIGASATAVDTAATRRSITMVCRMYTRRE